MNNWMKFYKNWVLTINEYSAYQNIIVLKNHIVRTRALWLVSYLGLSLSHVVLADSQQLYKNVQISIDPLSSYRYGVLGQVGKIWVHGEGDRQQLLAQVGGGIRMPIHRYPNCWRGGYLYKRLLNSRWTGGIEIGGPYAMVNLNGYWTSLCKEDKYSVHQKGGGIQVSLPSLPISPSFGKIFPALGIAYTKNKIGNQTPQSIGYPAIFIRPTYQLPNAFHYIRIAPEVIWEIGQKHPVRGKLTISFKAHEQNTPGKYLSMPMAEAPYIYEPLKVESMLEKVSIRPIEALTVEEVPALPIVGPVTINSYKAQSLQKALIDKNGDIAEELIKNDGDLSVTTNKGNTPLHFCILHPSLHPLVDLLLERGILLDAKNKNGETPLNLAIKVGALEVAYQLLQKNPSLLGDIKEIGQNREKDWQMLIGAVIASNKEKIKTILTKNPTLAVRPYRIQGKEKDMTALQIAFDHENEASIDYLMETDSWLSTQYPDMRFLTQYPYILNRILEDGIIEGRLTLVRMVIEKGVQKGLDLNKKINFIDFPLDVATLDEYSTIKSAVDVKSVREKRSVIAAFLRAKGATATSSTIKPKD